MFNESPISGKHLIIDIKKIKNTALLNDIDKFKELLDGFCSSFNIITKTEHKFIPFGFTILYLLSESHLSVHTFPEKQYFAFDLYTCNNKDTINEMYIEIFNTLVEQFDASGTYCIIDRGW